MSAEKQYRKVLIFVASPGDVSIERARLANVIEALNYGLADHLGLMLELKEWGRVAPGMSRAEDVILSQIPVDTWDFFVGILWLRFGTPSGGVDSQSGQKFESGTEEEFKLAYRAWKETGKPRIMFYRCTRPPASMMGFDVAQYHRVENFFEQFDPVKGAHPGLYENFDTPENFERMVRAHLERAIFDYSEKVYGHPIDPETVQAFAAKIPDTLPRRMPFFGRKEEISQALRALSPEDRGWGLVIDGIGGIGKTALAIEVACICKEMNLFDAFVFVTAKRERLEPTGIKQQTLAVTTLNSILNEISRVIGQPGITKLGMSKDKQRALRVELRGRRTLIILDNLETLTSAEQNTIGDFLRNLPQESKAIVTSRRSTAEGSATIRLEKLKWEEGRELITDQITRHPTELRTLAHAGETKWKQLYDEAGGSPLALLWTIGLIRARGLSFQKALALLRDGSAESNLNEFIYGEAQKTLDANEQATLGALSLFSGPATFEALAATANLERHALDSVLERLRAFSLVDVLDGDSLEERYTLHPLTRRFARAELTEDWELENLMEIRFARYWVDYARRYGGHGKGSYKKYHRLEAEWTNLEAEADWLWKKAGADAVNDKDAAQMLIDLVGALSHFLWFKGLWDERLRLNAQAYQAACALNAWPRAGWCAYDVALIHYNRAESDEAQLWADRCAEAWTRGGNKGEQASAMRMRGLISRQRTDYAEAERLCKEALSIWKDLGQDDDVTIVLNNLGSIARHQKDYELAEKYYLQALALAEKIGRNERRAYISENLGKLALDQKNWPQACKWFEDVLTLGNDIGRIDLMALGNEGLAYVYEAEGKAVQALSLAQAALTTYEKLRHRNLAEVRDLLKRLTVKLSVAS